MVLRPSGTEGKASVKAGAWARSDVARYSSAVVPRVLSEHGCREPITEAFAHECLRASIEGSIDRVDTGEELHECPVEEWGRETCTLPGKIVR